jgi:2-methylisocitrate lyase-like PEP mutase family enzyme
MTMDFNTADDKARRFRDLHAGPGAFVTPNPWDAGSALALAKLGFPALATSSANAAMVLGRKDGQITRDESIAHAKAIVEAVDIPVSADLENGFGPSPEDCAETIRRAIAIHLAGGSIEDSSGDPAQPIFGLDHAVARIAAAAAVAHAGPRPFMLTARCENFLNGRPDLDDTIDRLQAYAAAGADVLFAPGLPDLDAVRAVCAATAKPVNFMVGIKGKSFSVAELQAAGVRRISLATSLYRVAMAAMRRAATEVHEQGTFGYLDQT